MPHGRFRPEPGLPVGRSLGDLLDRWLHGRWDGGLAVGSVGCRLVRRSGRGRRVLREGCRLVCGHGGIAVRQGGAHCADPSSSSGRSTPGQLAARGSIARCGRASRTISASSAGSAGSQASISARGRTSVATSSIGEPANPGSTHSGCSRCRAASTASAWRSASMRSIHRLPGNVPVSPYEHEPAATATARRAMSLRSQQSRSRARRTAIRAPCPTGRFTDSGNVPSDRTAAPGRWTSRPPPPPARRPADRTDIHEGHRARRWSRHPPPPRHPRSLQAAAAGLRQADDLLPAVGADAGRDPGHPGDHHSRGQRRVPSTAGRRQRVGPADHLRRAAAAGGAGAGVPHRRASTSATTRSPWSSGTTSSTARTSPERWSTR